MRSDDKNFNEETKDLLITDSTENQMQILQNFYAKITGKKERLSKEISLNHITKFEDLENLHIKIVQMCGPLTVVHRNESITIFHSDDTKEQFSSFDRFRAYNKSSLSPTENVHLEYNILLTQPGIIDQQNYKISIDIHSRAAIMKKMISGSKMHKFIMNIIADNTASVRIDYVDYVVAVGFMNTIDGWFGTLRKSGDFRIIKWLKGWSDDFPFIFKYVSVAAFLLFCYIQFTDAAANTMDLFELSLIAFGGAYLLGGIGFRLGREAERKVDMIFPPSYVCLNRGDDDVAQLQASENRRGAIGALVSLAAALLFNVIGSYLAYLLKIN